MISQHARVRMQQRAIPPVIVDWLLIYGATQHDGHGAEVRSLDRRAICRIEAAEGPEVLKRYEQKLNTYLVESRGRIVTVGRRYRRLRRR